MPDTLSGNTQQHRTSDARMFWRCDADGMGTNLMYASQATYASQSSSRMSSMKKKPARERSADVEPWGQVASQGQDLGWRVHHLQNLPSGQGRMVVASGQ